MKLSIIVPCKNEEGNVTKLYEEINKVLEKIKYEIIYIDDGSTDNTIKVLRKLYEKDDRHIKVLSFSRNFNKEAAMLAGLEYANGEYISIIDADLQQNPKYLKEMYEFLENNKEYDEVAMVMKERNAESKFMAVCKGAFYKVMNKLCDIRLEKSASDFRMFRRNVKEALISIGERNRFSKGMFSWIGFNTKYLYYDVEPRNTGKSSFGFKNSLKYAFSGILAFSSKPLKLSTILGTLSLLSSLIYLIIFLIQMSTLDNIMLHIMFIVMLLMFGILFILLGIIGEYISIINTEVRKRPVYIVKEKLGFNDETIL